MIEALLVICAVLLVVCVALLAMSLRRRVDFSAIESAVTQSFERTERTVRDEISRNRDETANTSRQLREEIANTLKGVGDSLNQQLAAMVQKTETSLKNYGELMAGSLSDLGGAQRTQLGNVVENVAKLTETTDKRLETQRISIDERLKQIGSDSSLAARQQRDEISGSLKGFNDSMLKGIAQMAEAQHKQLQIFATQLQKLTESNEQKLETLRQSVELKLNQIQVDNAAKLEQMRATVDEKLQGTLEKRLGESFKLVSERLEAVAKGLGEMQTLASGVGDLKKVLTNVKTRGTWGEVQLGAMLEQVLNPDQYATNVSTRQNGDRVEFAIKLPGRGNDPSEVVWLPVDAKFPVEDYQRLVDAQEKADADLAELAAKQLESRIKQCAWEISEKYISPPNTTDFGILFLPTEGLFAEVIRRTGLAEYVQRECRVVIAGPTTLWSILNSLQMGFRTLAIEKRSSEVWNLLAAVKTEWSKYGEVLSGVQKKLALATSEIDKVAIRSRAIDRKLRDIQELPSEAAQSVLLIDSAGALDAESQN